MVATLLGGVWKRKISREGLKEAGKERDRQDWIGGDPLRGRLQHDRQTQRGTLTRQHMQAQPDPAQPGGAAYPAGGGSGA